MTDLPPIDKYIQSIQKQITIEAYEKRIEMIRVDFLRIFYRAFNPIRDGGTTLASFINSKTLSSFRAQNKHTLTNTRVIQGAKLITRSLEHAFKNFDNRIETESVLYKFINSFSLKTQINTLNNLFPFDEEKQSFCMPDYKIEHDKKFYLFNELSVKINFKKVPVERAITILSDGNKRNGHPHPHASEYGTLCFGDGLAAARIFWKKKDIVSLIMLIDEILKVYNHEDPYRSINSWDGEEEQIVCTNCNTSKSKSVIYYINGEYACLDCIIFSQKLNRYIWKTEAVYSNYQNSYINKITAVKVSRSGVFDYVMSTILTRQCNYCDNLVLNRESNKVNTSTNKVRIICSKCLDKIKLKKISRNYIDEEENQLKSIRRGSCIECGDNK